jgi:hypothetical protein
LESSGAIRCETSPNSLEERLEFSNPNVRCILMVSLLPKVKSHRYQLGSIEYNFCDSSLLEIMVRKSGSLARQISNWDESHDSIRVHFSFEVIPRSGAQFREVKFQLSSRFVMSDHLNWPRYFAGFKLKFSTMRYSIHVVIMRINLQEMDFFYHLLKNNDFWRVSVIWACRSHTATMWVWMSNIATKSPLAHQIPIGRHFSVDGMLWPWMLELKSDD